MTRLQSESSSIFASDLKKHTGGHGEASLECVCVCVCVCF